MMERSADVLVVIGRPKGPRRSYKQWEEDGIAPQVIFEVLSPSDRLHEMIREYRCYQTYGVEEYYIYDQGDDTLSGWVREGSELSEFPTINGWTSPRLGVRFDTSQTPLRLFGPDDRRLLTPREQRALEDSRRQTEEARRRAEEAERRAERLAERLRALGG